MPFAMTSSYLYYFITFVCDTPARCFLQCILPHTAKLGCGYCRCEGDYLYNRIIFPSCVSILRTDNDYSECKEENQVSLSPLSSIVGLQSKFPPEYMHLVCLGIVRKMFHYYFTRTKGLNLQCRLSQSLITQLNEDIAYVSRFTPREFQRKIRHLKELEHFKATEFRS